MRCSSIVVCLALVACGGDDTNKRLPDAPPLSDAPVDMPGPDQPVTLTITKDGQPMSGIKVYFVNPDDSLAMAASTNAQGTAQAVVAAGGSVTAINPFLSEVIAAGGRTDDLRTFAGVKPGDHLVLTQTQTQTVTFTLHASVATGANDYVVYTTCGTGSISPGGGGGSGSGSPDPGGTLSLDNCRGVADIAILARDVNGEAPSMGLYQGNVTLTEGGTVDLTGKTYSALTDVTFTYMHTPDASLEVLHFPVLAHGRLGPISVAMDGGVGTSHEPVTGATSGVVQTSIVSGGLSRHSIVDWGPAAPAYMLDLANLLLHDIVDSPRFNPTTRRVSWAESAEGAAADLTTTTVHVTRFAGEGSRSWRWEIAAPYTPGEVRYPRLPTDVFDFNATSNDSTFADRVTSAKVPGGYDAVRAHVLDVAEQLRNGSDLTALVAGASGRALVVRSQFLEVGGKPAPR